LQRHEVLHILDSAGAEACGIARRVGELARYLDRERYRVHVWFLYGDGPLVNELRAAGAQVRVVLWKGGSRDPAGAWRFWRALRQEKDRFAIIHEHLLGRSLRLLIRGATSAKLVSHLQVIWSREKAGVYKPVRKWNWGAHCVICNSRAAGQTVAGVRPRVVYEGINLLASFPRQVQGKPGQEVIGTAGRLVLIKGISYLLRAVDALRRTIPDVRLEIAGDGPLRASLEAEAASLGLSSHVKFLGWQEDLLPILERWAVYVQPSLIDATPITTLEAMSVGLPVVASAVGGLPEVVVDGETGWLVPPRDPGALADRLMSLIQNPQQARAMGVRGRERVRQVFSVERMVAEVQQLYDELLNLPGRTAHLKSGEPSTESLS
jgi:glycosyltransferase involved in cell wall biosynthesis